MLYLYICKKNLINTAMYLKKLLSLLIIFITSSTLFAQCPDPSNDSTPPTAVCQDITVQLDANGTVSITAADIDGGSTDNCGIASLNATISSFDCGDLGANTVSLFVIDTNGNAAGCTATVTVVDVIDPSIVSLPSTILLNNDSGACGAVATWTEPTSDDNCSGSSIAQTAGLANGAEFPVGTTIVTYTATDSSNNTTLESFSVTVTDNTDPTITCAADQTASATNGSCDAAVTVVAPTTDDNCAVTVTNDFNGTADASGTYPVGTTVVTWTVTDASNNTATCSMNITVTDDENPTIDNIPADISVNNDAGVCGADVTWVEPTSADNCTGSSIAQTAGLANGATFPVGVTTITYTATDASSNTFSASFTVTVTDNEAPTIDNLPANISVNTDAGVCGADVTWVEPTSADNCTGSTIAQTAGLANGATFPVGATTITYTATDAAGLTTDGSFTITVTDNEAPTIVGLPADIIVNNGNGVCEADVTWVEPTSADNCTGSTIAQTAGLANGATFPVGATTITYTATDAAGLTTDGSFTITVTDNEAPTIVGLPADIIVNNGNGVCEAAVTWVEPTSADNCAGSSIAQTAGLANGATFPAGVTTITYTATDASSNTFSASFTVTVTDNEAPTIDNLPANISVNTDAGVCGADVTWVEPTSADNCTGSSIAQTAGLANGATFPVGATTITYTATDASSNTFSASFTVTVTDNEAPTIVDLPANISVNTDAGVCGADVTWVEPTSADNCTGSTIAQTAGLANGATFPVGATTITYTATDAAGLTTDGSFTITVTDNEAPTIVGLPADIIVNNGNGVCEAAVTWVEPTSADNCAGSSIAQTAGLANGATFPAGVTTITYTATDASSNTFSASFTVTVTDNEAPTIDNLPADISVNNDAGVCGADVTWVEPTSADNCTGSTIAQTAGLANGATFPVGVTTVTYTATDASSNTFSASFTVTVTDNEAPTIDNLPANIAVNTDAGVCGADVTWVEPTSADNCTGSTIAQTAGLANGATFPVGATTITYTATDAAGLTTDGSFTITVTDNEAPTIVGLPADIIVNNGNGVCEADVTWVEPTPADNCAGSTIVQTAGLANGATFPAGVTTITYTATDAAGLTTDGSFTITVTDNEAPTIDNLPADISVNNDAGVCGADVTWVEPTSADNCTGSTIAQTAGTANGATFPVGVTTVTYTATDASSNTFSASFTVTVTDNEAPTIDNLPANIAVNTDAGVCGADVTWVEPTPADNCTGSTIAQTAGLANGATFPVGVTTITYTATDASSNAFSASFTVTVTDNEAPTIVDLPANIAVNNDAGVCGADVTWVEPTPADNCAGSTIAQTAGLANGATFPVGVTTITYTATDAAGLTTDGSFTITVTDNEAPTIDNLPADIAVNNDAGVCGADVTWVEPTPADNCAGSTIAQTAGDVSGSTFPVGTTTITYTATDAAGLTTDESFTITVTDNEDPTITCAADQTATTDAGNCTACSNCSGTYYCR